MPALGLGVCLFTGAMTALVSWRVSVSLGSPAGLAALAALPIVGAARSLALGIAALPVAAIAAGAILYDLQPGGASPVGDMLALAFSSAAIIGAHLLAGIVAGERMDEARDALGQVRLRRQRVTSALSRAGVCVVVLDRRLAWLEANDAAWTAFGCDPRVTRSADGRIEIDDEAAVALMHSGSQAAWRQMLEQVKADLTYRARHPTEAHGLRPYVATLQTLNGESQQYRFTVTASARAELVFVGVPVAAESAVDEGERSVQSWMQGVVDAIEEPAVVVLSDAGILVRNAAFASCAVGANPGARLHEVSDVSGVTESNFTNQIWVPTRLGAEDLVGVTLRGTGDAIGARIIPPGAPHYESVLLVFREGEGPVSPAFAENTQPADFDD